MKLNLASLLPLLFACAACHPAAKPNPTPLQPRVSSTLALTADDAWLWVVNPDADSVSLIDAHARALTAEVPLAAQPPAVDATTGRYDPQVRPRALALLPGDRTLYVAGQRSGAIYAIDTTARQVTATIFVGAEPTAVVAAPDGHALYAVSHQSALVSRIDPSTNQVTATLSVGEHPWGASVSADGKWLYVTHLLRGAGVTVIDTSNFTVRNVVALADEPQADDKRIPQGTPRGVYAAVPRPGTGEVWLPHLLLAVLTPEPDLDFQSTVFPTISRLQPDGMAEEKRLLFDPLDPPGVDGAFTDVVSGPHAVAFTPDGNLALVAMAQSEDVMVFDGASGHELSLVRPVPGALLEGIAIDHAGHRAYVDGRNSHNVVVLDLDPSDPITPAVVDGAPIDRLTTDPMPPNFRLGQRLFYTANSAAFPITRNFWVACSSCHLEGGTDAVTWRFFVGPRDTPSNAGGPIHTGFLLRQALRSSIADYDTTIDVEQGGSYHRLSMSQAPELQALSDFVNYGIPFPQNPNLAPDGKLTDAQARGQTLFTQRCATCHAGDYFTDSGAGNPTLDPNGPILLHDIGTCVQNGPFDDQPAPDEMGPGLMRTACDFDTPTLRGIFASAPYFHDGSAPTLRAVVDRLPFATDLSDAQKDDLVQYLLTL
ncbi:MAG: hypothetical protein ACHQ17_01125 [Polyangia bacterium]